MITNNYTLLFPKVVDWSKFTSNRPDIPFSNDVIEFLNALSASLMKDRMGHHYPEVITFAYFCRKANLLKLKAEYCHEDELRLGRGILFHIAPSNVPINFGYSLVAGLLAGNTNVVRVSSKEFAQVEIVIKHLYELMKIEKYDEILDRIALVRYDRMSDASKYFSQIANVRIIWGGDATIQTIRQYAIPARSFDVCFADRYSIALINPDSIIQASDSDMVKLAENFYNDTFLFDQNACSAPHSIFWLDTKTLMEAKVKFWKAIYRFAGERYQLQPVMSVDKLIAFYRQAVHIDIKAEKMPDNLIVRVDLQKLSVDIDKFRCACGYFSEKTIKDIDEIVPIISNKYQTLAYYGFTKEELKNFVKEKRLAGIDRITPIGETTVFSLTWDGYDLVRTLSRVI